MKIKLQRQGKTLVVKQWSAANSDTSMPPTICRQYSLPHGVSLYRLHAEARKQWPNARLWIVNDEGMAYIRPPAETLGDILATFERKAS